ncbi:hypothetical protein AVEN_35527-1 [Araneus ventricosus]|uniref:RNase H type-1 domain-containing protein n=1 Tax=Araneus ventricosus TaxID=182803 RepID=A0A4Y2DL59_ARAVE|nr:hypothetical protein AVEN_35527-1 [Araneus ventricosus]
MDVLHSLVEFHSLKPIASPLDSLSGVFFHTELLTHTNKSSQHLEYLRQAALEVINNIPIEATLIYTDGSKNEIGHRGSGGFVNHDRGEASLKRRNADYCSVFLSEMIAIGIDTFRLCSGTSIIRQDMDSLGQPKCCPIS